MNIKAFLCLKTKQEEGSEYYSRLLARREGRGEHPDQELAGV